MLPWIDQVNPSVLKVLYVACSEGCLMRTADAVSPITVAQAGGSLVAMLLLYTLLGAAGAFLMVPAARKGPQGA